MQKNDQKELGQKWVRKVWKNGGFWRNKNEEKNAISPLRLRCAMQHYFHWVIFQHFSSHLISILSFLKCNIFVLSLVETVHD